MYQQIVSKQATAENQLTEQKEPKIKKPQFDVATAINVGAREYQQDSVLASFSCGETYGIGVLADGMGGHLGGDVASAIVVGRVFMEVKTKLALSQGDPDVIRPILLDAVESANSAIANQVRETPRLRDMGSTLVACVLMGADLHWVSVGDSPLFLYRDGAMTRLNEDHSMAPHIDAMVVSGLISPELGADHPQRNQLRSAICGQEIQEIDCPVEPLSLLADDIVILASDGLQTLDDAEIGGIVHREREKNASEISNHLMCAVLAKKEPDQDNASVIVLKILSSQEYQQSNSHLVEDNSMPAVASVHAIDEIEEASDLLNAAFNI